MHELILPLSQEEAEILQETLRTYLNFSGDDKEIKDKVNAIKERLKLLMIK